MFVVMHNINDYDFESDGSSIDYFVGLFEDIKVAVSKCEEKFQQVLADEVNEGVDPEERKTVTVTQAGDERYVVTLADADGKWCETYHIYKPTLNELQ